MASITAAARRSLRSEMHRKHADVTSTNTTRLRRSWIIAAQLRPLFGRQAPGRSKATRRLVYGVKPSQRIFHIGRHGSPVGARVCLAEGMVPAIGRGLPPPAGVGPGCATVWRAGRAYSVVTCRPAACAGRQSRGKGSCARRAAGRGAVRRLLGLVCEVHSVNSTLCQGHRRASTLSLLDWQDGPAGGGGLRLGPGDGHGEWMDRVVRVPDGGARYALEGLQRLVHAELCH